MSTADKKSLIGFIGIVFIIAALAVFITFSQTPECYIIQSNQDCSVGYYIKYNDYCDTRLKMCCRGDDYLMKGVHGDKVCKYVLDNTYP